MDNSTETLKNLIPQQDDPIAIRRRAWRMLKDSVARYGIAVGGISVIISIVLIFFYLAYEVIPLFKPAHVETLTEYSLQTDRNSPTVYLGTEEHAEVGIQVQQNGLISYFDMVGGDIRDSFQLELDGAEITSYAFGRVDSDVIALGTSDGRVHVVKQRYKLSFPDDKRYVTPSIIFPLGEAPIVLDEAGRAIRKLALANDEEGSFLITGITEDNKVVFNQLSLEESLFGEGEMVSSLGTLPVMESTPEFVAVAGNLRWLFVTSTHGDISLYNVSNASAPSLIDSRHAVTDDQKITQAQMLMGGISLLVGYSDGELEQWFPAKDEEGNTYIANVRSFEAGDAAIRQIVPERQRKGFVTLDDNGNLGVHYSTSHRTLLNKDVESTSLQRVAISPRSNRIMLLDDQGKLRLWILDNEHPEISLSQLWGEVWYESWNEPDYVWQSSAANQDFEPKLSLAPLAFGTFKAAFYAMMVAVPLAIMGAIYTAYFMAPLMRQYVKPTIEIMEALPTVILGFLAGLWLAPFLEAHLPGVAIMLFMLPIGVLLFGYAWHKMPKHVRLLVPEGWDAALLIPVVAILAWLSFAISAPIEQAFFGGNMRGFITDDLGITYDQRNSIVIGFAMGFAVIPTIFSITEDAIFGVPKHLTMGSLALGATSWQTLVRVIMPSASPGIFSAIMIGLGRGVGETMIVLMATGNTPIMEMNIFEGMRTLAANIAVEMPEAEVASSHFRLLFLSGLVLLIFTFVLNTLAELIRQRLRKKYAQL
jgi:phosphate transport system permease protein